MKKTLMLIVATILCMGAQAQVQFGGKVGFDLTHFWGKDPEHGLKPGYQLGLMMEYKFNNRFAIAPEVVFAAQGEYDDIEEGRTVTVGNEKIYKENVHTKSTFNTNYINVPVMFKYYVSPAFSIDFGPQVGFNVYSKLTEEVKMDIDGAKSENKGTTDLGDATKAVDFGLGLGGTYNLTDHAFVQARYTLGLTEVFKETTAIEKNDAKNGNFQIAFGMKF